MEKYYKVKKEIAARGGFDEILRTEVDGHLMLSEKDLRMITLTLEEQLRGLGIDPDEGVTPGNPEEETNDENSEIIPEEEGIIDEEVEQVTGEDNE